MYSGFIAVCLEAGTGFLKRRQECKRMLSLWQDPFYMLKIVIYLYIMKEDLYAVVSLAFSSLNKFLYELSICIFGKNTPCITGSIF